jgi:Nucleoside 2-deoxyribosyltransferase
MTTPIAVVGGAYGELCCYPTSRICRGSGFRAASILAGLGDNVALHTVLGPLLASEFSRIAFRKKIQLCASNGEADYWFRYRHPLAKPDISPAPTPVSRRDVCVTDALVYGMLEGRPKVSAKRAVYDPQDGARSKLFEINGSVADELAIVASLSEALAISGKATPEEAATELLAMPTCVAVVVKCGAQGALVATRADKKWIGAFSTKKVWKIGSGDVFSAAYAHAWLREGKTPLEAAWFASRMVGEYVETRRESFSATEMQEIRADAAEALGKRTRTEACTVPDSQIYLAGPFFTTGQQWLVDEAREAFLELGFKVFSPVHDVGRGGPGEVVNADLAGLEESKLLFALLDGLDAGTIFEVGYACAQGIPVVGVAESLTEQPLTMLLGSGCYISNDFTTAIYAACWRLMKNV